MCSSGWKRHNPALLKKELLPGMVLAIASYNHRKAPAGALKLLSK